MFIITLTKGPTKALRTLTEKFVTDKHTQIPFILYRVYIIHDIANMVLEVNGD